MSGDLLTGAIVPVVLALLAFGGTQLQRRLDRKRDTLNRQLEQRKLDDTARASQQARDDTAAERVREAAEATTALYREAFAELERQVGDAKRVAQEAKEKAAAAEDKAEAAEAEAQEAHRQSDVVIGKYDLLLRWASEAVRLDTSGTLPPLPAEVLADLPPRV